MKYVTATLLLFSMCFLTKAQVELHFEYEKECGNPLEESQIYDYRKGKITKIINAKKVVFEQVVRNGNEEKGKFTVKLAGLNPRGNKKAVKNFLLKNILNKEIKITGNTKKESDKKLTGIVWGAGFGDVNNYLLKNGMVRFLGPSYYSVSRYTNCVYQQVEKEAKKKKIGIWAENDTKKK